MDTTNDNTNNAIFSGSAEQAPAASQFFESLSVEFDNSNSALGAICASLVGHITQTNTPKTYKTTQCPKAPKRVRFKCKPLNPVITPSPSTSPTTSYIGSGRIGDLKHVPRKKRQSRIHPESSIGNIFGAASNIKEINMEEINALIKSVNDSGFFNRETVENMTSAMKTGKSISDKVQDVKDGILWQNKYEIIAFCLGIWSMNMYRANSKKPYLFAGLLLCVASIVKITGKLPQLSSLSTTKPQSGIEEGVRDTMSYLITLLCLCFSKKDISSNIVSSIIQLPKMGDGIDMIICSIKTSVQGVYEVIMKHFSNSEPSLLFPSVYPQVQKALENAKDIEKLANTGQLSGNEASISKVESVICDLEALLKEIPRTPKTSGVCSDIYGLLGKMRKRLEYLYMISSANGHLRQEPVGVMMKGEPGTFKTIQTSMLAYDLICSIFDQSKLKDFMVDPKRYIYYKRMGEKYWDTYTSEHQLTIMDDFGQSTDSAGGESSEFLDWIRAINTAPYPLNMAALDNKGKSYFHSKFVLATTNLENVRPVSIISAGAVTRRVDFLVRIKARPEYATRHGRFDVDKMPVKEVDSGTTTRLSLDMFTYQLETWEGKLHGDVMLYGEFKQLLLSKYHEKARHYQALTSELNTISKTAMDKYLDHVEEISKVVPESGIGAWPSDPEPVLTFGRPALRKSPRSKPTPETLRAQQLIEMYSRPRLVETMDTLCISDPYIQMGSLEKTIEMFLHRYGSEFDRLFEYGYPDDGEVSDFAENISNEIYEDFFEVEGTLSKIKTWFEIKKQSAQEWVDENFPFLSGIMGIINSCGSLAWLTIIGTTVLMSAGAATLTVSLCNWFDSFFQTDYFGEPESVHKDVDHLKIERNSQKIKFMVQPQLGKDPNGVDIISSVIATNGYEISMIGKEEKKFGFALAIVDRVFIMPWHFITHLAAYYQKQPVSIRLIRKNKGNPIIFEMDGSVFINAHRESILQDNDLVSVKLPSFVSQHRDIRKYFCTEAVVSRMMGDMEITLNFPIVDNRSTAHVVGHFDDNVKVQDIDGSFYEIRKSISYNGANTKKGDCGAIIAWSNPRIQNEKIFGIHVAGAVSNSSGYGGIVTREMLDKVVTQDIDFLIDEEINPQCSLLEGPFDVIQANVRTPKVPTKTCYTKTRLYDLFGSDGLIEAPCQLDKIFSEGLYVNMTKKYCMREQPDINYGLESRELLQFLRSSSRNSCTPSIYSFEQAVIGDDEALRSIDRSTSAGWPHNLLTKSSKKSYFFGKNQVHDLVGPRAREIEAECLDYESKLAIGIRTPQNYTDFPKDDLVPLVKSEAGKIRLISACTLVSLISIRKYFGAFMSWITRNCVNNGSAIGVDPYSSDWDLIAKKLHSKGKTVNAGDYSDYDAKHVTSALWEVLNLINIWYSDGHDKIRQGLFYEIVNSRHAFMNRIVQWNGCMPPGNPLTSIINTLANHLYLRKCYSMLGLTRFDDHVFLICQGDDNLFSVSDTMKYKYNEFTVAEPMALQGLTYTLETKRVCSEYEPRVLEDCEFLKRSFRNHEHMKRYVGPLRLNKTLALCYWTKDNDVNILVSKMDVMSIELMLAGEETWNKYMPILLHKWQGIKGSNGWPKVTSYEDALGRLI